MIPMTHEEQCKRLYASYKRTCRPLFKLRSRDQSLDDFIDGMIRKLAESDDAWHVNEIMNLANECGKRRTAYYDYECREIDSSHQYLLDRIGDLSSASSARLVALNGQRAVAGGGVPPPAEERWSRGISNAFSILESVDELAAEEVANAASSAPERSAERAAEEWYAGDTPKNLKFKNDSVESWNERFPEIGISQEDAARLQYRDLLRYIIWRFALWRDEPERAIASFTSISMSDAFFASIVLPFSVIYTLGNSCKLYSVHPIKPKELFVDVIRLMHNIHTDMLKNETRKVITYDAAHCSNIVRLVSMDPNSAVTTNHIKTFFTLGWSPNTDPYLYDYSNDICDLYVEHILEKKLNDTSVMFSSKITTLANAFANISIKSVGYLQGQILALGGINDGTAHKNKIALMPFTDFFKDALLPIIEAELKKIGPVPRVRVHQKRNSRKKESLIKLDVFDLGYTIVLVALDVLNLIIDGVEIEKVPIEYLKEYYVASERAFKYTDRLFDGGGLKIQKLAELASRFTMYSNAVRISDPKVHEEMRRLNDLFVSLARNI